MSSRTYKKKTPINNCSVRMFQQTGVETEQFGASEEIIVET